MTGAPTGTVSPSAACSAVTTPAYGEGSSTAALTVSTSAIVWFTWTVHLRMSPSVSPSPRSGSLNCSMAMRSVLHDLVDGVEHPIQVGQPLVLEAAGRVLRVVAGHPQHRRLERVEGSLGDARRELR